MATVSRRRRTGRQCRLALLGLTLVYRDPGGRVADEALYREDEVRLELVEAERPWSF